MTESDAELQIAIRKLNARAWGVAGGLVSGVGLFLATNILLMAGAPVKAGMPIIELDVRQAQLAVDMANDQ